MERKAVALSADYGYINQVTATAKSLLYHNHNINLYVINTDIPQEWFSNINNRIKNINSQVINIHIDENIINKEHVSQPQINSLSYGRILIPHLINEDRVLYLDSDIVINGNLDELFSIDFEEFPLAAVPDVIYHGDFNTGVLMFNNQILQSMQPDIVEQMLAFGRQDDLAEGDQTVLNHFFNCHYRKLGYEYNYVIGYDFLNFYYPTDYDLFENFKNIEPKIIHFTGPQKPWEMTYSGRMRNYWWQYADLEWDEIIEHRPLPPIKDYSEKGQCLVFTCEDNLANIDTLVTALPNVTFNIAAWTVMSEKLLSLVKYPNVHLYPSIVGPELDRLKTQANCYLDINFGEKERTVLDSFIKQGKPIFSFESTSIDDYLQKGEISFKDNDVDALINAITKITNY